jgi:hypothetical protein
VLNDGPVTMVGAVAAGTRTFATLFSQGRFQDLTELMNMQVRNLGSSISNVGNLLANSLSGAYRLDDLNSSVSSSNVSSAASSRAISGVSSIASSAASSRAISRPSGYNPGSNYIARNIPPRNNANLLLNLSSRLEPIAQAQLEYGNAPSAPPLPNYLLPEVADLQRDGKRTMIERDAANSDSNSNSNINKRINKNNDNNNNNDAGGSKRKSKRRLIGTKKKRVIRRRSLRRSYRTKGRRRRTRKQIRRRRSSRR